MKFFLISVFFYNYSFSLTKQDQIMSFRQIHNDIKQIEARFKPQEVLFVFDIDNTILASTDDLGSDQWFNWKSRTINGDQDKFRTLLDWTEVLFYISSMRLTEDYANNFIHELQEQSYKVVSLTSRSPVNRVATQRELSRYGIDFNRNKIGRDFGYTEFNGRLISYQNGIFMTSGLNKGEMLNELIIHARAHMVKQIIFMDDHKKHTDRVFNKFAYSGIEVLTYRYAMEDKLVKEFHESTHLQERSQRKLEELQELLFINHNRFIPLI